MSLDNHKITTYADNVADLPDYPSDAGYTAKQLKAIFDGRGDKEIKEKFNALIDELVEIIAGLEMANDSAEQNAKEHAEGIVSEHNTADGAHNDIRILVSELTRRLNALADSDDTTLDQLSELVAYIKDNRGLIEIITTSKANVSDVYDRNTVDTLLGEYATSEHADGLVSGHNTAGDAHGDIRSIISELTRRLNALADSDDITLDQLSELVAYIKDNRGLIEAITTLKANAADVYDRETVDAMLEERDNKISELEENMGDMDTALDSTIASQESILVMQKALIGGEA